MTTNIVPTQHQRVVVWIESGVLFLLTAFLCLHTIPRAWSQLNTDFPNYYMSARLAHEGFNTAREYEWVWLQRFKGSSPSAMPDNSRFADIAALQAHWEPAAADLLNFVSGLTQQDLDRVIEYKTMNFGVYSNPMWQSLQHVVNHGTYHRGQVTTMLRQLDAKPLLTDLMHFYRERAVAASA